MRLAATAVAVAAVAAPTITVAAAAVAAAATAAASSSSTSSSASALLTPGSRGERSACSWAPLCSWTAAPFDANAPPGSAVAAGGGDGARLSFSAVQTLRLNCVVDFPCLCCPSRSLLT